MKMCLKTGREMVVESGKVAKDRTRDGRKSEQGQDKKMVEDVSEDRTRRGTRRWERTGQNMAEEVGKDDAEDGRRCG